MQILFKYVYLFGLRRLLRLDLRGVGILHLLVVRALLSSLFCLSSLASLFLNGSFGSLLGLNTLLNGTSLGFNFLKVTLNDRSSKSSQLVKLGNIDALRGIVALIIEPFLVEKLVS